MAKLTRKSQKIFGSSAGSNTIAQFGSLAASAPVRYSGATADPDNIQALSQYLAGWTAALVGLGDPAVEDENALNWLWSRQLAYLFQAGTPEWDSGTTYYINSRVQDGGVIYKSITDANTGNATSDAANWIPDKPAFANTNAYTLGDILYASAVNTLTKLAGNSTTVKKCLFSTGTGSAANAPNYEQPSIANDTFPSVTKSSTYTVATGDRRIFVTSASAWNLTLPSAATMANQEFEIINADAAHTGNAVSIVGTISGFSSWKVNTVREKYKIYCDGTSYFIVDHKTDTAWAAAGALTITGTTTNPTKGSTKTVDQVKWRRVGGFAEIIYEYAQTTAGTAGSGDYKFAIPSTIGVVDTSLITLFTTVPGGVNLNPNTVGTVYASEQDFNAHNNVSLYDSSHVRFTFSNSATAGTVSSAGLPLSLTHIAYAARIMVPISGWDV